MRVTLVDDSVLLREGLAKLLADAGFEIAGQAGDRDEAMRSIAADPPDVVVLDIRMPPTHTDEGLAVAAEIRARYPDVAILVLSQYLETAYAMRLLADGTAHVGYLLKDRVGDVATLTDGIRRVASGDSVIDAEVVARLVAKRRQDSPLDALSEREREVLALMAEGRSNQAIGDRLFLSPKTVETHVRAIFTKLMLEPAADDHRRVLAVLTYLRG